jgi:hypothetical protein
MISRQHPDIRVMVGGRSIDRATALAVSLRHGMPVKVDLDEANPLARLPSLPDAIIVAVSDDNDRLLRAAVSQGIGYVDITRWIGRIEDARHICAGVGLKAPVVIASGWMAGAVSIAAALHGPVARPATRIDLDVLFSATDNSGPDSVSGFVDMDQSFPVWEDGKLRKVKGWSQPRSTVFSTGAIGRCYRYNSPDQMTLVECGLARSSSSRMAFDHAATNRLLSILARTGIWSLMPRAKRKAMLHNPGPGAPHEFVLTIETAGGKQRVSVRDELGQTHLTAAAAVAQVERVLGLAGQDPLAPSFSFPEQTTDAAADCQRLIDMGVQIRILAA